jgi:predicted DNA binding CopG/RHH family protein
MKKLKKTPAFKSEKEEFEFWSTHDSTDYLDWSKAQRAVFPNLHPSSKSVPIRFPIALLERLKTIAHKRHVAYQSLIKMILFDQVQREINKNCSTRINL